MCLFLKVGVDLPRIIVSTGMIGRCCESPLVNARDRGITKRRKLQITMRKVGFMVEISGELHPVFREGFMSRQA